MSENVKNIPSLEETDLPILRNLLGRADTYHDFGYQKSISRGETCQINDQGNGAFNTDMLNKSGNFYKKSDTQNTILHKELQEGIAIEAILNAHENSFRSRQIFSDLGIKANDFEHFMIKLYRHLYPDFFKSHKRFYLSHGLDEGEENKALSEIRKYLFEDVVDNGNIGIFIDTCTNGKVKEMFSQLSIGTHEKDVFSLTCLAQDWDEATTHNKNRIHGSLSFQNHNSNIEIGETFETKIGFGMKDKHLDSLIMRGYEIASSQYLHRQKLKFSVNNMCQLMKANAQPDAGHQATNNVEEANNIILNLTQSNIMKQTLPQDTGLENLLRVLTEIYPGKSELVKMTNFLYDIKRSMDYGQAEIVKYCNSKGGTVTPTQVYNKNGKVENVTFPSITNVSRFYFMTMDKLAWLRCIINNIPSIFTTTTNEVIVCPQRSYSQDPLEILETKLKNVNGLLDQIKNIDIADHSQNGTLKNINDSLENILKSWIKASSNAIIGNIEKRTDIDEDGKKWRKDVIEDFNTNVVQKLQQYQFRLISKISQFFNRIVSTEKDQVVKNIDEIIQLQTLRVTDSTSVDIQKRMKDLNSIYTQLIKLKNSIEISNSVHLFDMFEKNDKEHLPGFGAFTQIEVLAQKKGSPNGDAKYLARLLRIKGIELLTFNKLLQQMLKTPVLVPDGVETKTSLSPNTTTYVGIYTSHLFPKLVSKQSPRRMQFDDNTLLLQCNEIVNLFRNYVDAMEPSIDEMISSFDRDMDIFYTSGGGGVGGRAKTQTTKQLASEMLGKVRKKQKKQKLRQIQQQKLLRKKQQPLQLEQMEMDESQVLDLNAKWNKSFDDLLAKYDRDDLILESDRTYKNLIKIALSFKNNNELIELFKISKNETRPNYFRMISSLAEEMNLNERLHLLHISMDMSIQCTQENKLLSLYLPLCKKGALSNIIQEELNKEMLPYLNLKGHKTINLSTHENVLYGWIKDNDGTLKTQVQNNCNEFLLYVFSNLFATDDIVNNYLKGEYLVKEQLERIQKIRMMLESFTNEKVRYVLYSFFLNALKDCFPIISKSQDYDSMSNGEILMNLFDEYYEKEPTKKSSKRRPQENNTYGSNKHRRVGGRPPTKAMPHMKDYYTKYYKRYSELYYRDTKYNV